MLQLIAEGRPKDKWRRNRRQSGLSALSNNAFTRES
jgi:hypothetical protein